VAFPNSEILGRMASTNWNKVLCLKLVRRVNRIPKSVLGECAAGLLVAFLALYRWEKFDRILNRYWMNDLRVKGLHS
jgi:hypothetical protein